MLLVTIANHVVEGLAEAEEDDDVDDGEGEHVSRDHAEHHRHERTRQLDGAEAEDPF